MRSETLSVTGDTYIDGFQIRVQKDNKPHITPGSTAVHEATHAVAAIANGTSVKKATIEPGPGYLGLTELSRFDPIAAAAPHADGCSGTGHDVHIVAMMGIDVRAASSAALGVVGQNRQEIGAVASLLEEKKTITGSDIEASIREVGEKKKGHEKAIVFIKAADGSERSLKTDMHGGIVMIPGEWITLSQKTQGLGSRV